MRLNLTLDDDQSSRLTELADRTHVQPGTLARSLLLTALDQVSDPPPGSIVDLLDGIEGALERARLGSTDVQHGRVVQLDEL